MQALHRNFELRPLVDQIVDALLAEDDSRYAIYSTVRADDHDVHREVGVFLSEWIALEKLLRGLIPHSGESRAVMPTARQLERITILDPDTRNEINWLRRLRNELVHGVEPPQAPTLLRATQRLAVISRELRKRNGERQ